MVKVSFDYDGTLSLASVQSFALDLMKSGFDVWICTKRKFYQEPFYQGQNLDLQSVANFLNIPEQKIIFTQNQPKPIFLKQQNFFCHFDNNLVDLSIIGIETNVHPIRVGRGFDYQARFEQLLRNCDK